jgi:ketosteroid isomerase-like protein
VSQQNVEVVRRIYATGAFDRFELGTLLSPDFEYVNPADAVEPGVREGISEVEVALRRAADAFDVLEHRATRLYDAGAFVVAEVTFRGRGSASGAELEQEEVHTWTFRDGKVIRVEWGRDLVQALKAVGLEE